MSAHVINLRSRRPHPSEHRIERGSRAPIFDWSEDERAERDPFSLAFTPFEWSLLVATLEKSPHAAVQQLGEDVRRQLKEQTS